MRGKMCAPNWSQQWCSPCICWPQSCAIFISPGEFEQQQSAPFKLDQLANVRHLQIAFYDLENNLIESNEVTAQQGIETTPDWFKELMYTALQDIPTKRLPVYTDTIKLGELVVSPEPNSEISEAWHETKMLLAMISLVFLAVNIMVYLAVTHALRPISPYHQSPV